MSESTDVEAVSEGLTVDWGLWECVVINTHEQRVTITPEMQAQIAGVHGVIRVMVIGSYGWEAIVIADTSDRVGFIKEIEGIIFPSNED